MTADLIVTGRVWTLAGDRGLGEVAAIAIAQGRIVAAGSVADVEATSGRATRRLDLGADWVVLPGIIDAHLHAVAASLAAAEPDVTAATDLDGVLDTVAAAHRERAAAGDQTGWLVGRGWSLAQLGTFPTAAALESAAPGRPVVLESHDGHAAWASPAALRAAGIVAATPDPPGGVIARDERNEPSGVVLENAVPLLSRAVPLPNDEDVLRALSSYAATAARAGIVGWHDPGEADGAPLRWLRLMVRAYEDGALPQRVLVSFRQRELDDAVRAQLRSGDRLHSAPGAPRVGWLKLFADGTLGSRTAAMLEPYVVADGEQPPPAGPSGTLLADPEELAAAVAVAARAGITSQVHAIGDRAARVALTALDAALPASSAFRPRLEHVQAIAPDDIVRMAAGDVVASVQPIHLRTDAPDAARAWGDRLERAYPWRSLSAAGVILAFGSDAPIEPADPWAGIALAVTRHDPAWPGGMPFVTAERLDLATALRAACLGPARSAGDPEGGRLTPGYRADAVVVPLQPLASENTAEMEATRPVLTLIGGAEAYRDATWEPAPLVRS